MLGSNRSWTTFAVLDVDGIDCSPIAESLGAAVAQIWFDDDVGATAAFYAPDGWSAEFSVSLDRSKPSAEDRRLFNELVRRRIITVNQREKLLTKLRIGAAARATWLESDGLENLLGVAVRAPIPVPCSAELLATFIPDATIVPPKRAKSTVAKVKQAAKPKPARAQLAVTPDVVEIDRGVLALHVHYWIEIFQMNGWKLYNRYKKHLPAERRVEVDQLCNLVALGSEPAQVERVVEAILASVWTADDWSAAIRDPRLADDEPLGSDQRADWQRRLATL